MIFQINNSYYFKDPCNRYWELVPVHNCNVMMPFITKPITEDKFRDKLAEAGIKVTSSP